MKKNVIIGSLVAIASLLILSKDARQTFARTINCNSVDKMAEFKNTIDDFYMNQAKYK